MIAVIERMEASVANPVSVSALVAPTRLSRRQIERLFEREMGRSPSRYYLEVRLQRGHLLLVTSRLSVMEISLACGFASASHFSKVYRDAFGCNPNQTRLLSRENDQNPSTGSSSMTPMASQPAYKYA
ncbi:hypothetical protein X742_27050 [Mesorhizobium sp. LNHC232B00]|nr:hypothetical protein X742_27050 [Mesorhizobium sp. LNHC232B00]